MSALSLNARGAGIRDRDRLKVLLAAVGGGALLGCVAIGYQVRHKTTTELAIAAVVFALACAITGTPRRFLLAVVAFDLPLQWGKYLHWNTALAGVGEIPGFQITLTTFALAGLYALWIFDRQRRVSTRPRLRPALPLILYVAINAASLFVATSRSLAAYQLEMLAQTLLLFIYVISTVRTRTDVRFLIAALLSAMLLESVLILLMSAMSFNPSLLGLKSHVDVNLFGGRIGGTFGSPNAAAAYLCLMLPLAIGVLMSSEAGKLNTLALAVVPTGVIALLITQSRGGWISLVVSVGIIGIWASRRGLISGRTTAAAVVATLSLIVAFWGPISQRVSGNDGGAASSRVSLAKMAEKMIVANPALGVGVNNYGINLPKYAGPQFDGSWMYTVHDKYLLVWAEAGIGALLAFIWFLVATLRRGWRCLKASDPTLSPIAFCLAAGVAGQIVHMAVDIFQDRPQVEGLWLVAALLVCMDLILRSEQREQREQREQPGVKLTAVTDRGLSAARPSRRTPRPLLPHG